MATLAQLPYIPNCIYIGYSGGIDSHVLLHACALLPHIKSKIIAVYIHHGLQPQADAWAVHCQKTTQNLGITFLTYAVNAEHKVGESPEEAARNARYAVFKQLVNENDVLLLAQHQEDQLETVLLQLFRGSGLRGLAGMPQEITFSAGTMLRPLLCVNKKYIHHYALTHGLQWIEDPSNHDTVYDRNFLRNEIIPLLKMRWPSLDKTVSRSATHCAQAEAFIASMAQVDLHHVLDKVDHSIEIAALQTYTHTQQCFILREWFELLNMKMPSQNTIKRIFNDVIDAKDTHSPQLKLNHITLRRYRGKLIALNHENHTVEPCEWLNKTQQLVLSNKKVLTLMPAASGIAKKRWDDACVTIKTRQGGEKIRLPHRQGQHDLKKLFQDATIPPWLRDVMPLIYLDGQLAAVGNLWIAAEFYTETDLAYGISLE